MELDDIKSIRELIDYTLFNTEIEQLESAWKELFNLDYVSGDDFDPLYYYPQEDFESWFLVFKVRFEVCSDLGFNRRLEESDIQEWVRQQSKTDDNAIWQPTIADRVYNWYTQGLEFASKVKTMYEMNVSKEVFLYHIDASLKKEIEDFHSDWEIEELKHLQALLLLWVNRNFINEYADHSVWLMKRLDVYEDVNFGIKKEQDTQEKIDRHINTFQWKGNKPLDEVLKHFEPLGRMFADSSLEGLKMAFGGGNIYDIKGCIKPSNRNTTAVRYFIYNLTEQGYIYEVDSMDEVMNVLMDSSGSYRKAKSKFVLGEYTLDKAKDDQILTCINNLSQ